MKASELRIGNIVKYLYNNEEFNTINGIDTEYVYLKDLITIEYVEYNEIQPIELNKYWLLKLGFKEHLILGSFNLGQFRFHSQRPNQKADKFNIVTEIYFCEKQVLVVGGCKYVHQLQNLFFTLTNNELEIRN